MTTHNTSASTFVLVFCALLVLTATTVAVAFLDVGPLNNVVALTIAVTKAVLVILFFMEVRFSSELTWVVLGTGFAWLALMIIFIIADPLTRMWFSATSGFVQ